MNACLGTLNTVTILTRYLSVFLTDVADLYEGGGAGIPNPSVTGVSSDNGLSLLSPNPILGGRNYNISAVQVEGENEFGATQ